MNPTITRFLPPGLVLVAAVWCGWPTNPSTFEDLPPSAAKAARWKASDLQVAQVSSPTGNPFAPVLQPATQDLPTEVPQEPLDTGPQPPTSVELLAYIQLDGFAAAGGRQWAIINGRPRSIGDVVLKRGPFAWPCELTDIADDHAVLQCGPTRIHVAAIQRSAGSGSAEPDIAAVPLPSTPELPALPPMIPRPQRPVRTPGESS